VNETSTSKQYRRSYYRHDRGWSDDSEGAELRLDAISLERRSIESRNILYRPDGRGGWLALADESGFSARQRGFVWEAWKTAVNTQPFVAFRGYRVVDLEMLDDLLRDLTLYNEDGQILSGVLGAGYIFLLEEDDARTFVLRVRELGGLVSWGSPAAEGLPRLMERFRLLLSEIEEVRAQDAKAVAEARAGNFDLVAAFERRSRQFIADCEGAFELYSEIKRVLDALRDAGRTAAERAEGEALYREARELLARARLARDERSSDASELAWLAGAGGHKPTRRPPLAALELARAARAAGLEVFENEISVVVALNEELELSFGRDGLSVRARGREETTSAPLSPSAPRGAAEASGGRPRPLLDASP
jgi:hypothetical protein